MRRQNETFRRLARAPFGELLERCGPRPGPARLARRPGQPQGAPQREPRPRADGAVHPRHRPLHRGRRQGGRPGPDRLDGRRTARSARSPRGTTTARRRSSAGTGRWTRRRPRGDPPRPARRRPTGSPGGSAACSSARGPSTQAAIDALADGLRAARPRHRLGGRDGPPLAGLLRRRPTCGTRVVGPVEFVVGPVRALELLDPPPSTLVLADWAARLGQDLFYPPNVGGWPGGRAWLSTRALDRPGQLRRGARRGPRRRPARRRSTPLGAGRAARPRRRPRRRDRLLRRAAPGRRARPPTGTTGSPPALGPDRRWGPDGRPPRRRRSILACPEAQLG